MEITKQFKEELIQRAEAEQVLREEWNQDLDNPELIEKVRKIDAANTKFLKEVVKKYGWPKISEVGKKAAMAAWLISQHTPDPEFRRHCLVLMQEKPDEIEPQNLARTIDRVRILDGKLQYYGTHFKQKSDGTHEVIPTEGVENVEKRRAEMGLPTIEEKLKEYDGS